MKKLAAMALLACLAGCLRADNDREVYQLYFWPDAGVLAVTGLANLVPLALENKLITNRCPCDPNSVPPFDRGVIGNDNQVADSLSDASLGAILVGVPLLDLADLGIAWTPALQEDLLVYLEVLTVNGALVTAAKYGVQRPIPRLYAGQDPELVNSPDGYRAFYSGHTSFSFAALSAASVTFAYRHGASWWPWIATLGLGGSVALERVLAGRHFYSDVLVGAAAGTAVGTLVPWLHHRGVTVLARDDGAILAWTRHY